MQEAGADNVSAPISPYAAAKWAGAGYGAHVSTYSGCRSPWPTIHGLWASAGAER